MKRCFKDYCEAFADLITIMANDETKKLDICLQAIGTAGRKVSIKIRGPHGASALSGR